LVLAVVHGVLPRRSGGLAEGFEDGAILAERALPCGRITESNGLS